MEITKVLWVAAGGAGGSVARFLLGSWITARVASPFPWATLTINVLGSFLLGLLYGLGHERVPETARLALGVGVLGGFTTFSSFEYEVLQLSSHGLGGQAAIYAGASVLLGLAAAWTGWALGSRGRLW